MIVNGNNASFVLARSLTILNLQPSKLLRPLSRLPNSQVELESYKAVRSTPIRPPFPTLQELQPGARILKAGM